MHSDEKAIRMLVDDWQAASTTGDWQRLQAMMAEDVIFLMPGQPPMVGRQAFMDAFQEGLKHYRIESHGEIKELRVIEDFAYCWTQLSVIITPHSHGLQMRRTGNVLSILQKQPQSGWVIIRDANMMTPEPASVPASAPA